MEDIVQRVFAVIFAVIVFFLMPLYMTFEKKDDISYALALKITSNFVNSVKSKGYLTADMYTDFLTELGATGNTYEVKLQHIAKSYNPVINVYDKDKKLVDTLDYERHKEAYEKFEKSKKSNKPVTVSIIGFNGPTNYNNSQYSMEISYKASNMYFNERQIMEYLSQSDTKSYFTLSDTEYKEKDVENIPYKPLTYVEKENNVQIPIYTMSVGDEFGVIIRNNNATLATVMFDALTFSGITSDIPRVYINYGGVIKNEEYKELI